MTAPTPETCSDMISPSAGDRTVCRSTWSREGSRRSCSSRSFALVLIAYPGHARSDLCTALARCSELAASFGDLAARLGFRSLELQNAGALHEPIGQKLLVGRQLIGRVAGVHLELQRIGLRLRLAFLRLQSSVLDSASSPSASRFAFGSSSTTKRGLRYKARAKAIR
jgi:hypothetical protein